MPLNIVVKDTDEYVVDRIVGHSISDPDTQCRVRWVGYEASGDTWESLANIKDVEVFHDFCVDNKLQRFIPRLHIRYVCVKRRKGTRACKALDDLSRWIVFNFNFLNFSGQDRIRWIVVNLFVI